MAGGFEVARGALGKAFKAAGIAAVLVAGFDLITNEGELGRNVGDNSITRNASFNIGGHEIDFGKPIEVLGNMYSMAGHGITNWLAPLAGELAGDVVSLTDTWADQQAYERTLSSDTPLETDTSSSDAKPTQVAANETPAWAVSAPTGMG